MCHLHPRRCRGFFDGKGPFRTYRPAKARTTYWSRNKGKSLTSMAAKCIFPSYQYMSKLAINPNQCQPILKRKSLSELGRNQKFSSLVNVTASYPDADCRHPF